MIYLVLSILCSVTIVSLFKVFERYNLDTYALIVLNYLVCVLCGTIFTETDWISRAYQHFFQWGYVALIMGFLFINIFRLVGTVASRIGVSVATVSMKLGFVVPVMIAVSNYGERLSWLKVLGVLCALPAVVLSSWKEDPASGKFNPALLVLPIIIFLGSGICDSITQFVRHQVPDPKDAASFVITSFFSACFFGFIGLGLSKFKKNSSPWYSRLNYPNALAGLVLGIPNYGSFYFVVLALQKSGLDDIQLFPVNNIGIVSVASLSSFLIFREKLNIKNALGIGFALISILLIAFS